MIKRMDKKMFTILRTKKCLSKPMHLTLGVVLKDFFEVSQQMATKTIKITQHAELSLNFSPIKI